MLVSRRCFLASVSAFAAVSPALSAAGAITPPHFSSSAALAAINDARRSRSKAPLTLGGALNSLATRTARHLARLERMTHAPDGQQLIERARLTGVGGEIAENLADGYETFEEAIAAWIASGYHRTTMFSERYTRFGAAVAVSPNAIPGDTGIFWVTEFGD
jgi:uncharacterized protein YkwD